MKLEHSEGSARQAKHDRKRLQKEIAAELRRKDREKLARLRAAIKGAKSSKRERIRRAAAACRRHRKRFAALAKERRGELLAALRAELEQERESARTACRARKAKLREKANLSIAEAEVVLEAERALQRELRAAEDRHRQKHRAHRSAQERRAESDDHVRANLPPELVGVFNVVRKDIKPSARMSRTEAFLLWAERNPGEVVAMQSDQAEQDVEKLVREYERHHQATRHPKRYRRSAEELARELAQEVPF